MTQNSPEPDKNWQALSQLEGQIDSFINAWPLHSPELIAALAQALSTIQSEKEKIGRREEEPEPIITAAVYARDEQAARAQCKIYARRNRIQYTQISVEIKNDVAGGFYYVCTFT